MASDGCQFVDSHKSTGSPFSRCSCIPFLIERDLNNGGSIILLSFSQSSGSNTFFETDLFVLFKSVNVPPQHS